MKLLVIALLAFSASVFAVEPGKGTLADVAPSDPMPAPAPLFSGCSKSGKVCYAPSVAVTIAAYNFSTKKIEAAFSPGIGYGFTINPGSFRSFGAEVHFTMDPGAQNMDLSALVNLFNGFFHFGVSKGFVGDTSWRLLAGPGVSVAL